MTHAKKFDAVITINDHWDTICDYTDSKGVKKQVSCFTKDLKKYYPEFYEAQLLTV